MGAGSLGDLVSGLYGRKRATRLLFMLQAFIDESEDDSVLSMGGYVSTFEKWEEFETAWNLVLQQYPRIEYFKYREFLRADGSYRGDGQFRGMSEDDAMLKVADLYNVVGEHVIAYVSCAVNPSLYRAMFKRFPKPITSPYYFCLLKIMNLLPGILSANGLAGPVEFIFDRQVMEEKAILEVWYFFEEQGIIDKAVIKSAPAFRDDRDALPLQAADMLAGRMRHSLRNKFGIIAPVPVPMRPTQRVIPGHHFAVTEGELKELVRYLDLCYRLPITGVFGEHRFFSVNLADHKRD